jgi:hypothetical protein
MRLDVLAGIALGGAIASFVACHPAPTVDSFERRMSKHNEISALWTQIRGWRRDAAMDLDPAMQMMSYVRGKSVREGVKPCLAAKPRACDDVCGLGDAICDNAEAICNLAAELGKDDDFAQEKCASAKASCVEAQQRCCDCSTSPPAPAPETAP